MVNEMFRSGSGVMVGVMLMGALAPGVGCHSPTATPSSLVSPCGDVLTAHNARPSQAEFLECSPGSGQVLMTARYRVRGAAAAEVEAELRERFGMAPLVFVCCGWEPREGRDGTFAPDEGTRVHRIRMHSSETTLDTRAQWSEIESFFVVAEILDI